MAPKKSGKGSSDGISTFKIDMTTGPLFFSVLILNGTKNWDWSQILFGQKFPKTAIVL